MRIECPICGSRDLREFYVQGSAQAMQRPAPDAGSAAWDDYLHQRDNTAGVERELWYHEAGCTSWLVVERNVSTHEIHAVTLAEEAS